MNPYLRQIAYAIKKGKCWHAFCNGNYIGSYYTELVKDCFNKAGFRVIYLSNQ